MRQTGPGLFLQKRAVSVLKNTDGNISTNNVESDNIKNNKDSSQNGGDV